MVVVSNHVVRKIVFYPTYYNVTMEYVNSTFDNILPLPDHVSARHDDFGALVNGFIRFGREAVVNIVYYFAQLPGPSDELENTRL
ncbi:MAG: hypothetical protein OXD47_09515 [Gammaproteobacteria bacterium]|nr:hypothetical protein [Gammaproteobacteria bacterium]